MHGVEQLKFGQAIQSLFGMGSEPVNIFFHSLIGGATLEVNLVGKCLIVWDN